MQRVFAFEDIDGALPLLPLSARRALDLAGRKLSLAAWRVLPLSQRRLLVDAGGAAAVPLQSVQAVADAASIPADVIPARDESAWAALPAEVAALKVSEAAWQRLDGLQRFALYHLSAKPQRHALLPRALAELGLTQRQPEVGEPGQLTHLAADGEARMVNVAHKAITHRRAVAAARVRMAPSSARLIVDSAGPKGDVLAVARIAGIQAAKRTPELIPLCHGIVLTKVAVSFNVDAEAGLVDIEASAEAVDRTGVEMEAMVAASVAALTIYDMLKAVQRDIVVEQVVLVEKQGGRSGHYRHEPYLSAK